MMIGYKYRLSAGSRKTGPSSGGNSSKSNKHSHKQPRGCLLELLMVGLREGKQSGQQDLQVAETLQQMKILKGEKRQATAPRKVHKFDKAKELMFVWSNYILY